jgi:hypothetical protein
MSDNASEAGLFGALSDAVLAVIEGLAVAADVTWGAEGGITLRNRPSLSCRFLSRTS